MYFEDNQEKGNVFCGTSKLKTTELYCMGRIPSLIETFLRGGGGGQAIFRNITVSRHILLQ